MPETCWDRSLIINIELVVSCWFSLSPCVHDARSQEPKLKEFCLVCFLKFLVQFPNVVPLDIRPLSPVWYPVDLLKSADGLDHFIEGNRERRQSSCLSAGLWGSCVWKLLMPYSCQFCLILNIHCISPGTSSVMKMWGSFVYCTQWASCKLSKP